MNFEGQQKPNLSVEQKKKITELFKILKKAYELNNYETHNKIADEIERLDNNYSDPEKGIRGRELLTRCSLYHLLVNSTTLPDNQPDFFDLPNGEIETFLISLQKIKP